MAALDTGVVYSASLDRTLRSWDTNTGNDPFPSLFSNLGEFLDIQMSPGLLLGNSIVQSLDYC